LHSIQKITKGQTNLSLQAFIMRVGKGWSLIRELSSKHQVGSHQCRVYKEAIFNASETRAKWGKSFCRPIRSETVALILSKLIKPNFLFD
jgi:hypothetical protein